MKRRREFSRVPKIFIIHVSLEGKKHSIPALMVDIGLGGMKTLSKMYIPLGEEVCLVIEEDEENIEIPAESAWSREMDIESDLHFGIKYMSGFKFKMSPEQVKEKIFERFGVLDFIGWTHDMISGHERESL